MKKLIEKMAYNKEYHKQYRLKNKDKKKEYNKQYRKNNKEERKKYLLINKDKIISQTKQYRLKNRDRISKVIHAYYEKNKNVINKYNKQYFQDNKEGRNAYQRMKKKKNLSFRLRCLLNSRIWFALKKYKKSKSTTQLVGCSLDYLKDYLESQFDDEMSWSNYGAWHIDHIKPCASFDLSKPEEQQRCFHYSNLQPLWARDNWSKHSKIN